MKKHTFERCLLSVGLIVVMAAVSVVSSVSSAPAMLDGVAVGSLTETRARLAQNAKIGAVRADVTFDAGFQNTYSLSLKHGFMIVGILDYKSLNYNNSFTLVDWKRLVDRAQKTYPSIQVWEIWNEPTVTKYRLGYMDGTPQHYVEMLNSAYTTLKTANPNYVIIGLGGAQLGISKDYSFAQSVFSLGGGAYMNAISIHAYPYLLNVGQSWEYYKQLWSKELVQYRQFGKPIWVTETGLQSNQKDEASQSTYLQASHLFFQQEGTVSYFWFQLIDYTGSDGTIRMWGLLRIDQSTKPSYSTYRSLH